MNKTSRTVPGVLMVVLMALLVVGGLYNAGYFSDRDEVTSEQVGASFKDIAELSTEEYAFTSVAKHENPGKEIFGQHVPLTGNSFLVTFDGTVKAGVKDLTRVNVKVDNDANKIVLRAPRSEVISTEIDPNSMTVFDQSLNPFNPVKVSEAAKLLADEEKNAEKKAVDDGLLRRADDRVKELLVTHTQALVERTDEEAYEIVVEWM